MEIDRTKLTYRKLNSGDTDLFVKLRLDFLTASQKALNETEQGEIAESLKRYFTKHLEANDFIGMICEYNGNAVSVVYLLINEKPANASFLNGKAGTILNVYTYPEYRRNGISINILKRIIDEAKKQDVSVIDLLATQDGEKVYRKLGFTETEDKSMRLKL